SAADARWLREQALRAKLAAPGLVGSIASLPERAARKRVLDALTARTADQPGELSAEDGKRLDEWVAALRAPSPDELTRLARAGVGVKDVVVFDPSTRIGTPEAESGKVVEFARRIDAAVVGLGT